MNLLCYYKNLLKFPNENCIISPSVGLINEFIVCRTRTKQMLWLGLRYKIQAKINIVIDSSHKFSSSSH